MARQRDVVEGGPAPSRNYTGTDRHAEFIRTFDGRIALNRFSTHEMDVETENRRNPDDV